MKRLSFLHLLSATSPAGGGSALFLVGLAVNAGSLLSWALIGSVFGLHLLWAFLPLVIALPAAQYISARLGVSTRKELTGLIRENFRLKTTVFMLAGLLLTDSINLVAQFAGIAASLEIFGFSPYFTVPAAVLLIRWMTRKGVYPSAEKVFLLTGIFYCLLIAAGITVSSWEQVLPALRPLDFALENDYLTMLLALIGATMAPRILLYSQSAAAKKNVTADQHKHCRYILTGGLIIVIFAFLTVAAYAGTLFVHNVVPANANTASLALQPLTGSWSPALFAFILLSASLFSASAIPLSAAYSFCDIIGCKAGFDKSRQAAPVFYRFSACFLLLGAAPVLLPDPSFLNIMLWSQISNGILLPFLLFFLLRLSDNQDIVGQSAGFRIENGLTWISSGLTFLLLILLAAAFLVPDCYPAAAFAFLPAFQK